jgi:putative toxin-antitoxin system antitoxin component (TIGR02293 family)
MSTSVETVKQKAAEVLGGYDEAEFWLTAPARGLDYRTPSDLLATDEGRQQVLEMLMRMDYGVYW